MQLQFIILLAPLLISQAYACMTMDAVKFADAVVSAQIHDNGDNTCNFPNSASTGVDDQYWFECQSGYAAWLSADMDTLAYAANGGNYRFITTVTGTQEECDPSNGACGTSTRYRATGWC